MSVSVACSDHGNDLFICRTTFAATGGGSRLAEMACRWAVTDTRHCVRAPVPARDRVDWLATPLCRTVGRRPEGELGAVAQAQLRTRGDPPIDRSSLSLWFPRSSPARPSSRSSGHQGFWCDVAYGRVRRSPRKAHARSARPWYSGRCWTQLARQARSQPSQFRIFPEHVEVDVLPTPTRLFSHPSSPVRSVTYCTKPATTVVSLPVLVSQPGPAAPGRLDVRRRAAVCSDRFPRPRYGARPGLR